MSKGAYWSPVIVCLIVGDFTLGISGQMPAYLFILIALVALGLKFYSKTNNQLPSKGSQLVNGVAYAAALAFVMGFIFIFIVADQYAKSWSS